jgi:hypothetical protein
MSNGFELDADTAFEYMARTEMIADAVGNTIIHAVVCQHDTAMDGVGSHGGFIAASALDAVEGAQMVNRDAPPDHPCKYVPVALSLSVPTAMAINQAKMQGLGPQLDDEGGKSDA